MSISTLESGLLLLAVAVAAGLLGCFVVMRRMVLAADALSHVALPGIGIALMVQAHPLAGAFSALLIGTLFIWGIEQRSKLATETVIGVVFSGALALGTLLTSGDELIEALLGETRTLSTWEVLLALVGACAVVAFLALRRRELLVSLVSRDIATSMGIQLRWLDLQFMLAFAATVALGLRYLGVLLMGSLVIIPAATARRLSGTLRGTLLIAVAIAVLSTLVGSSLAARFDRPTGPPIVLVACLFFLLGLFRRPGAAANPSRRTLIRPDALDRSRTGEP